MKKDMLFTNKRGITSLYIYVEGQYIGSVNTDKEIKVIPANKTLNKLMIQTDGDFLHCANIEFFSNTVWNVYITKE